MAALKSAKILSRSNIGAPAQHNQPSRKGKKAWRKNVNVEDVEEGLDSMRAEERATGKTLQKTADDDLFVVDTAGDEQLRKNLAPRFSTSALTSTKILSQRSAVPPIFSRATSTNAADRERKRKMTSEEKERLLRIAKRPRKGPFNSILDLTEYKDGSGLVELSQAVKESGVYDPWAPQDAEDREEKEEFVPEPRKVKAPSTERLRDQISIPAVSDPHQGTSYNPLVDAHQELVLQAAEAEEKRLKQMERLAEVKTKMEKARLQDDSVAGLGVPGMKIDQATDNGEDVKEEEVDAAIVKSHSLVKKTKAQRNKERKLLSEKRVLAEKAANKRLLASIPLAKGLRRTTARQIAERELEHAQKKLALKDKLRRHGLAGQRLGRYKVPERQLEVQLGDDLTESLRGIKPEGNLFRDRFLSLQQRALIEPRVPVIPTKRKKRIIEYEKHAWKRFQ